MGFNRHVCKFGDRFCGRFGYDDLCEYCKRKADLELAAEENEMSGAKALRRRQSQDAANEAVGEFIVTHPILTLGGILAAVGVAIAADNSDKKKEAKEASKKLEPYPMSKSKK